MLLVAHFYLITHIFSMYTQLLAHTHQTSPSLPKLVRKASFRFTYVSSRSSKRTSVKTIRKNISNLNFYLNKCIQNQLFWISSIVLSAFSGIYKVIELFLRSFCARLNEITFDAFLLRSIDIWLYNFWYTLFLTF